MFLIDNRIQDSTLIQIGKDLGILPEIAEITEENIDKVVNATWFSLDLILPINAIKVEEGQGSLKIEAYD